MQGEVREEEVTLFERHPRPWKMFLLVDDGPQTNRGTIYDKNLKSVLGVFIDYDVGRSIVDAINAYETIEIKKERLGLCKECGVPIFEWERCVCGCDIIQIYGVYPGPYYKGQNPEGAIYIKITPRRVLRAG